MSCCLLEYQIHFCLEYRNTVIVASHSMLTATFIFEYCWHMLPIFPTTFHFDSLRKIMRLALMYVHPVHCIYCIFTRYRWELAVKWLVVVSFINHSVGAYQIQHVFFSLNSWKWRMRIQSTSFSNRREACFNQQCVIIFLLNPTILPAHNTPKLHLCILPFCHNRMLYRRSCDFSAPYYCCIVFSFLLL